MSRDKNGPEIDAMKVGRRQSAGATVTVTDQRYVRVDRDNDTNLMTGRETRRGDVKGGSRRS